MKKIHQGKNVMRLREMQGMQQAQLAYELGVGWTVNKIFLLEQQEIIEDSLLTQIADILKVYVEAIKNLQEGEHIYATKSFKTATDKLRFPVVSTTNN